MTVVGRIIFLALWLLLSAAIGAYVWLCYRRTRVPSFLVLGAVVLLWPWFDSLTEAARRHFMGMVLEGRRPWLFPFSLMVLGDEPCRPWQVPLGEFAAKFNTAKDLLLLVLLALVFAFIARSFRANSPRHRETK